MAYQNYCCLAYGEPAVYQYPSSASHKQREDGIKGIGG